MDASALFSRDRYVILRSWLPKPQLSLTYGYVSKLAAQGIMRPGDEQVPGTPCRSGDWVMDGLLSDLLPAVEKASGVHLFPTYAYFRVYKPGDILKAHRDRPSCEVSVSLCLGYSAPAPWPIWIAGPNGLTAASLGPGDALLYRGTECEHWREPFEGDHQAQAFLHYVDQNGSYADWKYDKRPGLRINFKPLAAPTGG
jgi:hypothetical protein